MGFSKRKREVSAIEYLKIHRYGRLPGEDPRHIRDGLRRQRKHMTGRREEEMTEAGQSCCVSKDDNEDSLLPTNLRSRIRVRVKTIYTYKSTRFLIKPTKKAVKSATEKRIY